MENNKKNQQTLSNTGLHLGLDIGGSGLRVANLKKGFEFTSIYKSNFKELSDGIQFRQETNPNDVLDVAIRYSDTSAIVKRIVAGESEKLYPVTTTRLYNDMAKSLSEDTVICMIYGIYKELERLNLLGNKSVEIDNLELLLPAIEVYSNSGQSLKRKLTGAKIVISLPLLSGMTTVIKINNVELCQEGISSALYLHNIGKIDLTDKYSVVIDCGERTTNVALMDGTEIVSGAVDTFKLCGQVLKGRIKSTLRENDIETTEKDIISILRTGKYRRSQDFTELLYTIKGEFVKDLYDKVMEFLSSKSMSLPMVDTIILTGRTFSDSGHFADIVQDKFANQEIISETDELNNIHYLCLKANQQQNQNQPQTNTDTNKDPDQTKNNQAPQVANINSEDLLSMI